MKLFRKRKAILDFFELVMSVSNKNLSNASEISVVIDRQFDLSSLKFIVR